VSEPPVGREPTPEQRNAIETRDGDVFCEAGAGTGKTRVLVGRYCGALLEDGAKIDEILAFTFTERAAAELRQRIRRELAARGERRLARDTEGAWVTTIHGFCRRLLAAHPVAAGLDPRFRVLDAPESQRLLSQAAREAVDALVTGGNETVQRVTAAYRPWRIRDITLMAHERLRSQGMAAPRLPEVGEPKRSQKDDDRDLSVDERRFALEARAAFDAVLDETNRRYSELKRIRSGLDFSDLEIHAVELLRTSPAVRDQWHGRFKHLMVDEFQDTNRVQLDLVDQLRGTETRLFTVGDEHQSIYRFRNADLEVFRAQRRKAEESPTTEVLPLRGNFRSRPPILDAANAFGDTLLENFAHLVVGEGSDQDIPGSPEVELLLTYQEGTGAKHLKWKDHEGVMKRPQSETNLAIVAQARALAERLRELVDDEEVNRGDIVVLLRAFTHVDAYEEALRRFGLEPYVVGGRGYWSQQQVEDILRLLGVVANPLDDEMLFGALACPAVGVTPDTLWLLRAAAGKGHVWPALEIGFGARTDDESDFELDEPERLEQVEEGDASKLRDFCEKLGALRAEAPLLPLDVLVERAMNAFSYDLALLAKSQPAGRMANVRKLMRIAAEFERNEGRDLRTFLVQAAESTQRDEREGLAPVQAEDHDGVRIMTVHGAKGLEFPVVAVPELDRALQAGRRNSDIWIGRVNDEGEPCRFGLRLAFPTEKSFGVWELEELNSEEKEADAEEACRLNYVAMTRAQDRLLLSGQYKDKDCVASEPDPKDSVLKRILPLLVDSGWDETSGLVNWPVPLQVRVQRPSEERAIALTPAPPSAALPTEDVLGAMPPILEGGRSVVPLGHLSYSALDAFKRCGYRFYVERVLGVRAGLVTAAAPREDDGDEPDEEARAGDELHEPDDDAVVGGAGPSPALALGNAVHAALEWSARAGWEHPGPERLAALLAREGVEDSEVLARATRLVDGWLGSALCAELRDARVRPEAPFVLPLGGTVLRGNIDLLATPNNGSDKGDAAIVVDFKTDRVGSDGVVPLGERYASQRAVYALAASGSGGGGPVRTAHVFLERPDEPVVEVFDEAALATARASLEGLIAQIRAGSFEVTHEPYAALCFGCPAAPRLCPRPAWRPSRDAPAPVR
jgi:ATP-dependent exoDNAse (exonuclease V) beta subunit